MAILCPTHRLLFIQAPRTGCTAIENLLVERFGGESMPPADIVGSDGFIRVGRKHCTVAQLVAEHLIAPDYSRRFVTATTVRNPFDSLVSLYVKKRDTYHGDRFLKDPNSWVHRVRGFVDDMEFCRNHSFDEWLAKRYSVSKWEKLVGRGRRSLSDRYTNGVSVIMRFERLQEDFSSLMRQLGIEGDVTIPSINVTRQRQSRYQDYYTREARQLVEYVFEPELRRYKYSFDGLSEPPARSPFAEART